MARLKNEEPIEEAITVRPTGNYIATLKQSVGRYAGIFSSSQILNEIVL